MKMKSADPKKKLSEIFLRYVAPLLEGVPEGVAPEVLRNSMILPMLIWNVAALKRWGRKTNYTPQLIVEKIKEMGPAIPDLGEKIVRMWYKRKRDMFPNENWAVEDVMVYRNFNNEMMVRIIARAPEKFRNQMPQAMDAKHYRSTIN